MNTRTILPALLCLLCLRAAAQGGKLIILVEETPYTNETYYSLEGDAKPFDAIKKEWDAGKNVVSAKRGPFGWFFVSAKNTPYSGQGYNYNTTKQIKRDIDQKAQEGRFLSSLGFSDVAVGKLMWLAVYSKRPQWSGQVSAQLKTGGIAKWAEKKAAEGYRITALGGYLKWIVTACKGTGIRRQRIEVYSSPEEMLEDMGYKWEQGYSVQLAECNVKGTCVVVYCTWEDGHIPRQRLKVCSTAEEAKAFIAENTGNGRQITQLGGSYLEGIYANYSKQERRSMIMNDLTGIASSTTQLASEIQANKRGGGGTVTDTGGDTGGGSSGGGASQASYQSTYDRFADNAESTYKSLKSHDWGSKAASLKKSIRAAQKNMRETRLNALKHGYTLKQSPYETISF
ncbi:MAG: hypothetical protein LUC86_02160 [Prevotellaceae bacterium]|nr:hypothetical protein [Prevotellaceae bacterium]